MQKNLPFAEAEGTYAERQSLLWSALSKVECDCWLKSLVLWVFNTTAGGGDGELVKTYQELAEQPRGLCCSERTARRITARARSLGLIAVTENRYRIGGQKASGYTIDWAGVRRLLKTQSAPGRTALGDCCADTQSAPDRSNVKGSGEGTVANPLPLSHLPKPPVAAGLRGHLVVTERPPGVTERPPSVTERPPGRDCEATPIRNSILKYSSDITLPEPVPEAGRPVPSLEGGEEERRKAEGGRRNSQPPIPDPPSPTPDVPSLAAAARRGVAPLPVGEHFQHGIFPGLQAKHLRSVPSLIRWFRMQLATAWPIGQANEAGLLLVLAAAEYAMDFPAERIIKSRVALFVRIISNGQWQKVQCKLPAVTRKLDELLERYGRELLEGETWPPRCVAAGLAPREKEAIS